MTISKLNEITYGCISTIHCLDECLWKISIHRHDDIYVVDISFLDGYFAVSYIVELEKKLSKSLHAAVVSISFSAVHNCFSYTYIDKND